MLKSTWLNWSVVTVLAIGATYCGVRKTRTVTVQAPAPTTPASCDGVEVGTTKTEDCGVYLCAADGELKKILDTCAPPPPATPTATFLSFADATRHALENAATLDADEQDDYRYVLTGHRGEDAPVYAKAVAKAINSVSRERALVEVQEVVPGLVRFKLEDAGLNAAEWQFVEDSAAIDIEDQTTTGVLLKTLTRTRKPLVHADVLIDTLFRNSAVYHQLAQIPITFQELVRQAGVNYAADLKDFDAVQLAFVGSPLSPHNRMMSRHDGADGGFWCTYDTGPTDTAEKNYFEFPCLGDNGCVKTTAQFVAGECIFPARNGTHRYALYNAKDTLLRGKFVRSDIDRRQDVAPVNVVLDYRAAALGLSAEIRSSISCFGCHVAGLIPAKDQIRAHVLANGSEFGADKDRILAAYPGDREVASVFAKDNAEYASVMQSLGVSLEQEPITHSNDNFLTPWDLARVAHFFGFADPETFKALINQSAGARAQVGQLASGGRITFDQFVLSVPVLIDELRLFKDPLE